MARIFRTTVLGGVLFLLPVVVIFVTLAACYAPARRAGRVSPVAVLRSE